MTASHLAEVILSFLKESISFSD